MKFLPFVLKHLRRNWIRTLSHGAGHGHLHLPLLHAADGAGRDQQHARELERHPPRHAATRSASSSACRCPTRSASRAVPGVKRVATTTWFGGSLPAKKEGKAEGDAETTTTDWSNFFPNMAVDAEPYFAMYPEFEIPPDQYQAFMEDLQGASSGASSPSKFGWKLGDRFFLESFIPPYRKKSGPFEFVVRAIFDADPVKHPGTDTNLMLSTTSTSTRARASASAAGHLHHRDRRSRAGGRGQQGHRRARSRTATRRPTPRPSRPSPPASSPWPATWRFLLNSIGLAVSFTILLVTANTMSMAVRERRTEIAVLKTLGFSSRQVMGLIVAEALALGALGGGLGIAGSQGHHVRAHPRPGHQGHAGRHRPLRAAPQAGDRRARVRGRPRPGLRRRLRARPQRLPRRGSPTC